MAGARLELARRVAVVVLLVAALGAHRIATPGALLAGDGQYSWLFARSLAFDGDLDFANDYALCGDPWGKGADEGGGRPANPFYLGPGLVNAPVLFVVRHVVRLPESAPASWRVGCDGPLVNITLSTGVLEAVLTLWLGFLLARRWAGEGASLLAMPAVAFGTSLFHYAAVLPSYSHNLAALGVALALVAWMRARAGGLRPGPWALAGLAIGFAALMRPQQGALLVLPAITLAARLFERVRARRWPWREIGAGAATLAGFFALYWIQLYVYKVLYGHMWVVPQGRLYLQFAHAHPWLLLFFPRGFFAWTPLAWLGVIGLVLLVVRRASRGVGATIAAWVAIEIYIASAALVWTGGGTFGARVLVSLSAPLVLGTAITFDKIARWLDAWPGARGVAIAGAWLAPWVFVLLGASRAQRLNILSDGDTIRSSTVMYADSVRAELQHIDSDSGNPLVWPASLVFAARYGVHPRRFEDYAQYGMFGHVYRPVSVEGPDAIDFGAASTQELLVEGMSRGPAGTVLKAPHGRMIVPLAWPYITHVKIEAHAPLGRPATLRIRSGSFWRRRDVATVQIEGSIEGPIDGKRATSVEVPVPRDAFDSGINEILLDVDDDIVITKWTWIDHAEHDTRLY